MGTLAVIVTLGVGLGLNSILFTVFQAFFLAPLPGMREDPRLFWFNVEQASGARSAASYAEYLEVAASAPSSIAAVAAFTPARVTLGRASDPEPLGSEFVTPSYFSVFGVRPTVGRLLVAEDDVSPQTGGPAVAVISERLWKRRFGGERDIVGRSATIGALNVMIVGVAADGFAGPVFGVATDVWMPLSLYGSVDPDLRGVLENPAAGILQLAGLARQSASTAVIEASATRAVQSVVARLGADDRLAGRRIRLVPVTGGVQDVNHGLTLPLAVIASILTGLVLIVVATNVGGLLLARSLGRYREFGIRAALGASRGRIVRQLLTETVLLWVIAGLLGFGLALAASAVARATLDVAPNVVLAPNFGVFGATMLLALVCGMVFGLAPGVMASRADLLSVTKDDPASPSGRRSRLRVAFVIGQLAGSLVLLAVTGQMLLSLKNSTNIDPGFEPSNNVLAMYFDAKAAGIPYTQRSALYDEILTRVSRRPGVLVASIANMLPLGSIATSTRVLPSGAPTGAVDIRFNSVRPGYFRAIGTDLLKGRDFDSADRNGAPRVVVVNETLARLFWPGKEPLGQQISYAGNGGASRALTVIGVARDGKYGSLSEPATPFMYLPSLQETRDVSGATLLVRMATRADIQADAIRREVLSLEPRLASTERHETLAAYLANQLEPRRRGALFVVAFGTFALLLACVGVYGATSQFVALRTREFGIRLALGAQASQVRGFVLREGLRIGILGVIVGTVGALVVTRGIGATILGASHWNLSTLLLACVVLLSSISIASWLPAYRATRVDPVAALRHE